jgi:hypothetical protein
MAMAYALAYYKIATLATIKTFIAQAPVFELIKTQGS